MAERLDVLDHVAVHVASIAEAVEWYTRTLRCRVAYRDDTWALLEFANLRLALMAEGRHPPHLAVARPDAERFGLLQPHRDGTRSVYLADPAGNAVEILLATPRGG